VFTGRHYRLPLLPFERQLIEALGCTEEEYRRFVAEADWRGVRRPAYYEHLPEVRADVVSIVVSLVIGIALSAASSLLTPKPKAPSSGDRTRQRRLSNLGGPDRFSPTSGFDTQADLANYGDPVPIIFGRYTGETGGVLVAPRLVWSRAFSLGSQQAVKLLFAVGEQGLGDGIARPEVNGIFLGNTALDVIYYHDFAFYWKRNTNDYARIRAQNLAYGTRGSRVAGDIESSDDVFLCPTITAAADTGFSNAFSLTANAQFGVYSAIPNATNYRVNWRVVSIVKLEDQEDDPGDVLLAERVKIAGDYGFDPKTKQGRRKIRQQGQKGVGRNYGRRMGLTHLNGSAPSDPTELRTASIGDVATFTIESGQLPKDTYYLDPSAKNVSVDDINSEINAGRRQADDMLQVGETIMIGRTVWVVESRALPTWTKGQRQTIQLRCIELFGTGLGASIGLVNRDMVDRGIYNDDDGKTNANNGLGYNAGPGYYPLTRVAFGVVRNTRACDVTEIGLKSQVWQRANGLCNFRSLPRPEQLVRSDNSRVQIQSGTMTLYMERTSCWTIWLRPAGTNTNGQEYAWQPLGEQFCVTGDAPQDQFNYLRIKHPQRQQFEFRLIPKSGADIARHSPDDEVLWQLNASNGQSLGGSYMTAYGAFEVQSHGRLVTAKEITFNREMLNGVDFTDGDASYTIPNALEVESYLPDVEDDGVRALTVGWDAWLPDPPYESGRRGACHYELYGSPLYQGQTATARRTFNLGDGRNITIEFNGIVDDQFPSSHPFFPNQPMWSFSSINVISSSSGFNTSQVINCGLPVTSGNIYATTYGLPSAGVRLIILSTTGTSLTTGRQSAWAYELMGNQQAFPIGYRKTAEFSIASSSGGFATIIATGVVTSRPEPSLANFPGQTQAWDISYEVDPTATTGTWVNGALMENNAEVSTGNPFYKGGTFVGVRLRVLSLQTVALPPDFVADRVFELKSQITDVSFYNSLLQKSNENQPEHEIVYVNESIANETVPQYSQLTLCGLALKASRNFTSLDQLRVWLKDGIPVRRFNSSNGTDIGPSNMLTDLVYFLLTDKTAGAGAVVSPDLIKTEDLPATSQFLEQNKLAFDGALDQPTNLRQFISDIAPYFLCNFVIADGKFSLVPSVPTDSSGGISSAPVKIKQLFTSGNIIEGSFGVEYLSAEERKDFQAVMRFRRERRNHLPEERTLVVRWAELGAQDASIEAFDMTQYCTSRDHALLVAKFFLSIRRRVTHSVRFRTTPYGLDLAPGDYIKVITQASPYSAANNGVIDAQGNITSATELGDGSYSIVYWTPTSDGSDYATMTVAAGKVVQPALWGAIFTISNVSTSSNVYMVEQLTLNEDGLVEIAATEFPCTSTDNSLIALDLMSDGGFEIEG
jgi:hypothetical protein